MLNFPPPWRNRATTALGDDFSPTDCMNTGGPTAAIVSATGVIRRNIHRRLRARLCASEHTCPRRRSYIYQPLGTQTT
jgi:hypothetical protein